MFLNDLSISFVSFVGIVFLVVAVTFSKNVRTFTAQLSSKRKKRYSASNDSTHPHIAIQVNPFAQLNESNNHRQRVLAIPLDDGNTGDDDDELILYDVASISAMSFGETNAIELRLDQDLDDDDDRDLENEPGH